MVGLPDKGHVQTVEEGAAALAQGAEIRDRKCYGCGEKGHTWKNCLISTGISQMLMAAEADDDEEAPVAKFRAAFRSLLDGKAQAFVAGNTRSSRTPRIGRLSAHVQATHIVK